MGFSAESRRHDTPEDVENIYPQAALKDKQQAVENFWNAKPCDSDVSDKQQHSRDYYTEIEADRYTHQCHILQLLESLDLAGKRVLEVGTGVGTDARTIIRLGGLYTGINVDSGSCEMTQQALVAFELSGEVLKASALSVPYADGTFDTVYSYGVLHHIPEVQVAIAEIFRVLKPGGQLVIMLYNRPSINYRIEIQFLRKLGVRLLRVPGVIPILTRFGLPTAKLQRHLDLFRDFGTIGDDEWLSRNTDGPDNPYSRVYNAAETTQLLADFEGIEQRIRFFDHQHWGLAGRLIPAAIRDALGARWGWHRIAIVRKPQSTAGLPTDPELL